MSAAEVIRRLHRHRAWANGLLLDAAARLDDGQLRAEHPVGQGSVWRTLLHLYAAEYVWLAALQGDEDPLTPGDLPGRLPGNQLGPGAAAGLDELRARWADLDARWDAWLAGLTDADLSAVVAKRSTSSGAGRVHATAALDVLLHLCTHAQYTASQAVQMLRRSGVAALPDLMLITLARSEAAAAG